MKVYTVHLNLVTKTGATFQIPVRSFDNEADAKKESQATTTNLTIASRAKMFMPLPNGELDDMSTTFGATLQELGIKSFATSISWTEVGPLETLEAPKVRLH